MRIDNSAFSAYSKCPMLYWEKYEAPQSDVQSTGDGRQLVQISGANSEGLPGQQSMVDAPSGAGGAQGLSSGGLASSPTNHSGLADGRSASSDNPASMDRGTEGLIADGTALPKGIELDEPAEGRDFGTRMHQLLDERRRRQLGLNVLPTGEWPDEAIEAEAQATLAAYEAHYIRDLEFLESERTHVLALPQRCPECWSWGKTGNLLGPDERWCEHCECIFGTHELVVKLDAVVRYADRTIGAFDTKTESKQGHNTREDWASRTQAKVYLYALKLLYPFERVSRLVVDVISRRSPKALRGPIFTRLDDIGFAPEVIEECIRNFVWVAEDIQRSRARGWWRANTNLCKDGWKICDYRALHVLGRTLENLRKYRAAEDYLNLDD